MIEFPIRPDPYYSEPQIVSIGGLVQNIQEEYEITKSK